MNELRDKVKQLESENERLRALLSVAGYSKDSETQEIRNDQIKWDNDMFVAQKEIERLRAALRTLVATIHEYDHVELDSEVIDDLDLIDVHVGISLLDLRQAAAVLGDELL